MMLVRSVASVERLVYDVRAVFEVLNGVAESADPPVQPCRAGVDVLVAWLVA